MQHRLEQWQAGRLNRPLFKGPHVESLKETAGKAPEGSMAAVWKKSKESPKG